MGLWAWSSGQATTTLSDRSGSSLLCGSRPDFPSVLDSPGSPGTPFLPGFTPACCPRSGFVPSCHSSCRDTSTTWLSHAWPHRSTRSRKLPLDFEAHWRRLQYRQPVVGMGRWKWLVPRGDQALSWGWGLACLVLTSWLPRTMCRVTTYCILAVCTQELGQRSVWSTGVQGAARQVWG